MHDSLICRFGQIGISKVCIECAIKQNIKFKFSKHQLNINLDSREMIFFRLNCKRPNIEYLLHELKPPKEMD